MKGHEIGDAMHDKVILITGGTGKLGKELVRVFPTSVHPLHEELDVTDNEAVASFVNRVDPEIVIHCAALASVSGCEENRETAWNTNVEGTKNLVTSCSRLGNGCKFVYISTACVFHGDKGDYREDDIPYPKNFYSLTKLLGEFVVENSELKKPLIIRTNFMARESWPYPKAFIDRFGTYLFADDLALAIHSVLIQGHEGILHVCGEDRLSMYELARITTPDIQPMTLAEYSGPPLTVDMSLKSIRIPPFRISRSFPS